MGHLDKATRPREIQKKQQRRLIEREKQRQAGRGELGSRPGCGEVGCRDTGEGGVEWSSRCWGVSHQREAILLSFPLGRLPPKEGRIFFILRARERDRQKRGVRESVDYDSGPRTTWQWRREGEITHQSLWNLIQLSQD